MANYYTSLSFVLALPTPRLIGWAASVLLDPPEALRPEGFEPGDELFNHKLGEDNIWISADGGVNLETVAAFCQAYLNHPDCPVTSVGFEYAYTCSSMRIDGFGGGACFITAASAKGCQGPKFFCTADWLHQQTV